MLYLRSFTLPNEGAEWSALSADMKCKRTCYQSRYPFGVFQNRGLQRLEFEPVTILCGGNGSGKTTLLNLIGEKLGLQRGSVFNRSSFYGGYLKLCHGDTALSFDRTAHANSRVITSDDVFQYLLDLRCINEGIEEKREQLLKEQALKRNSTMKMSSLDDLEELRKVVDAKRFTASRYVNERLMKDIPAKSNGESGFMYFTNHIREGGLYLLDEPENSLSANLQLELVRFLEDSARFYGCQFVIATHSPLLLSMKGAKIYDLDTVPVSTCRWTQVPNVQTFYRFFQEHREEFEQ